MGGGEGVCCGRIQNSSELQTWSLPPKRLRSSKARPWSTSSRNRSKRFGSGSVDCEYIYLIDSFQQVKCVFVCVYVPHYELVLTLLFIVGVNRDYERKINQSNSCFCCSKLSCRGFIIMYPSKWCLISTCCPRRTMMLAVNLMTHHVRILKRTSRLNDTKALLENPHFFQFLRFILTLLIKPKPILHPINTLVTFLSF